ncbi:cystatin-F [Heteronotia binoei]|uniref:cystatin-F n=1 Tax=Heteronotia binoei TaxID=13085 RepID=UPI00292E5EA9|nr:cystatin-F [Heteronotia binoei]XP_060092974.1 cystatin-F [Heteronotia binoei]XP_060092975.1 cystatin-F [Heteronotia binoei]
MSFRWSIAVFCFLTLFDAARTSSGSFRQLPSSRINPGFPVPINTNDPGVRKAARDGVYKYNNSSNDIFLFKESCINKAMVQVVRGLKYNLHVDIARTVCTKREHPSLDRCHFQKQKKLRQKFRCYFEVWLTPWLQKTEVLVSHCQ